MILRDPKLSRADLAAHLTRCSTPSANWRSPRRSRTTLLDVDDLADELDATIMANVASSLTEVARGRLGDAADRCSHAPSRGLATPPFAALSGARRYRQRRHRSDGDRVRDRDQHPNLPRHHVANTREMAVWLCRHRRRWCRGGALAVLCVVGARSLERVEDDVLIVSLDRLLPALRVRAGTSHARCFSPHRNHTADHCPRPQPSTSRMRAKRVSALRATELQSPQADRRRSDGRGVESRDASSIVASISSA